VCAAFDVVIVGAGVSGLYAAFKLLGVRSVLVLERQPRLGGRVVTEKHYGHILEYGPMRFEPDLQPLFAQLVRELELPLTQFAPYTCPRTLPDLNSLSFEEVKALHESPGMAPAFALLQHGLRLVLGEQWDIAGDDIRDQSRDARKGWLRKHGLFQGRLLHAHGLWDTLAHVLSKGALDFLQTKGTFYHALSLNPNAADTISFMLDILATQSRGLFSIQGGSARLVEALHARVRDGGADVRLGAGVAALRHGSDGRVVVELEDGAQVTASHALLTCSKHGLKRICGLPAPLRPLLDTVMVARLFKVFVILESPPFGEHDTPAPNFGADKLPCREIHYAYNAANNTGVVMVYGDEPSLNYWAAFDTAGGVDGLPQSNANPHLKNHLLFYLRQIFPGARSCFSILHYGLLDWSRDHTGVHLWRPGACSGAVCQRLAAGEEGVHVCGETYSTYQGFIEGGLRMVEQTLTGLD